MVAKKRCPYCGRLFVPDPRVGSRQKACSAQCQKLRKKDNNRAFTCNNPGYWASRYPDVKEWRREHPEYQRQWRQRRKQTANPAEIQAEMIQKAFDSLEKNLYLLRKIQAEILMKAIDGAAKKPLFTCRR
ncbi:MAG: hypothetical protein M0Z52_02475 [Actinomycetota bacterium]|nr:hypothetical protein [Actinomycetota bacterium]